MAEPIARGPEHFDPPNLDFTSVDVGNRTVNLIPGEARARFNIRYNDLHTPETLKALIERRCAAAAGATRWRIEYLPSNSWVFLTKPGPFVDLVVDAIAAATGGRRQLSTSGGPSAAGF